MEEKRDPRDFKSLDEWLDEEGFREEVERAAKRDVGETEERDGLLKRLEFMLEQAIAEFDINTLEDAIGYIRARPPECSEG